MCNIAPNTSERLLDNAVHVRWRNMYVTCHKRTVQYAEIPPRNSAHNHFLPHSTRIVMYVQLLSYVNRGVWGAILIVHLLKLNSGICHKGIIAMQVKQHKMAHPTVSKHRREFKALKPTRKITPLWVNSTQASWVAMQR